MYNGHLEELRNETSPISDLIFDSETMPGWFGMPEDADLPSTFSVDYVRAWKKK